MKVLEQCSSALCVALCRTRYVVRRTCRLDVEDEVSSSSAGMDSCNFYRKALTTEALVTQSLRTSPTVDHKRFGVICFLLVALLWLSSSSHFSIGRAAFLDTEILSQHLHPESELAETRVLGSLFRRRFLRNYYGDSDVSRNSLQYESFVLGSLSGVSNESTDGKTLQSIQTEKNNSVKKSIPTPTLFIGSDRVSNPEKYFVKNAATVDCEGKRVYMYALPAKFNSLIRKRCEKDMVEWLDFCPHLENEGFGQPLQSMPGWYATDPYMLEVIFHSRMENYRCLTRSPADADAFFIPYYSGLDALRFLYGKDISRRGDQGLDLVAWLDEHANETWKRRGGHDHFIIMGRTSWDFNRPLLVPEGWGTSLRAQPALENVTALFLEKMTWKWNEQAIPYPTSFHPSSQAALHAWLQSIRLSPRSNLFSFSGAARSGQAGTIRGLITKQCLHSSSECAFVDCQKIGCSHNPEPIIQLFLHSDFCLQPPGDTPTRRSTFDGLLAGCIPVFFSNDSAYTQYTWHLPTDQPDAYSVFIAEKALQEGVAIQDVLRKYSREQRSGMRENIISLIPGLIYASSRGASELEACGVRDAFHVSLDGILGKASKSREEFGQG